MKTRILITIIFLIIFPNTLQDDVCPLIISAGKLKNQIYANDLVSDQYSKLSSNPMIVSPEDVTSYFYVLIIKENHPDYEPDLKVKITQSSEKFLNTTYKIIKESVPIETLIKEEIEVIYNCSDSERDSIDIELTIEAKNCKNINLYWKKICIPLGRLPIINVGSLPGKFDLIKNGAFVTKHLTNKITESTMVIPKEENELTLFLSYAKPGESITLEHPQINVDSSILEITLNNIETQIKISNNEIPIKINFSCLPYKKEIVDVEIILKFENYDSAPLLFKKSCDNLGEIQEYFTILYVIYWILLILILIFLVAIFFYYMKKNEITFNDIYEKVLESVKSFFSNKKKSSMTNYKEELYDDNDLIDIKITTTKIKGKEAETRSNVTSYGGI